MSQNELLLWLKKEKRAVTMRELVEHFGVRQQNLARKVRKLNEQGYLQVVIDGRRRLIKYKRKTIQIIEPSMCPLYLLQNKHCVVCRNEKAAVKTAAIGGFMTLLIFWNALNHIPEQETAKTLAIM